MTGTDIVPTKSFEEKLKDRIRDSIGELMTDEDLQRIVERGIDEVFFDERTEGYGYNLKRHSPLIHEVVKEVLKDRMNKAVDAWLSTHEEEVKTAVDRAVTQGAGNALVNSLNMWFEGSMHAMQSQIHQDLQNR